LALTDDYILPGTWLPSQQVQMHEELAQNCAGAAPWLDVNMATIQPHVLRANLLVSTWKHFSQRQTEKDASFPASSAAVKQVEFIILKPHGILQNQATHFCQTSVQSNSHQNEI